MKNEIYYFSGTGNSLYIAKDIAEKIGAALIPIGAMINQDIITTDAEVIGIIFPVYYMETPMIIEEFTKKLNNIKGKYIFAVCTYGGAAGASLRILKRLIRSNGGELSSAYGIGMPQNSFPKSYENPQRKYESWKTKLEMIAKNIDSRTKGIFYSNVCLEIAMIPICMFIIRPLCKNHFKKISNLPSGLTYEEYKHAMDRNFYTNANCNGCGICSKVCPVGNIKIIEKKPVWLNKCEHCIACYNWCPDKAIRGGVAAKDFYYHHPDVNISEMFL